MLRYLSVCSGVESASVAWHDLGWTPVAFSEIEPFPSAVLKHRFPHVPNLGDMIKYKEWPLKAGDIDLLVGGTPCFVAGTLILTKRGLLPIEQVRVGDEVVSHLGRWQRVLRIGSKLAPTRRVIGQGHNGIVTTDEHPFYASTVTPKWDNEKRVYVRTFGPMEWVEAKDIKGRMWSSLTQYPSDAIPLIEAEGRESKSVEVTLELMRVVGAWVGDGWVRDTPRPGRKNSNWGIVVICAGKGRKADQLRAWLNDAGLAHDEGEERTTTRFSMHSAAWVRWLTANFGRGSDRKTIPAWLFGASEEMRAAFLDGYLRTDGHATPTGYGFTTVSKSLALGVSMLIRSTRRHATTVSLNKPNRECRIEGRVVNERPSYSVRACFKSRSSVEHEGYRLGLVRSSEPTGDVEAVFNVEVEGDNSYIADGLCVHNCQSFSVAGLRKGLDDPRGNLMLVYLGLAEHFRVPWLVWENVPGVLSSNGGRDFGTFLGALGQLGYRWSYRVLDAQYFGVPQRRRRVFVVASLDDRPHPAKVLFEPESLRGDSAKSGQKRQKPPRGAGTGAESGGGVNAYRMTAFGQYADDDSASTCKQRDHKDATDLVVTATGPVTHCLKARGFAGSEDGTGRGTPIIPVAFHPTQDPISSTGVTHALGTGSKGGCATVAVATVTGTLSSRGSAGGGLGTDFEVAGGLQAVDIYNGRITGDTTATLTKAMSQTNGSGAQGMTPTMQVRRLLPIECEFLQGFPADWTLIPWKGKPASECPDGPRYKAMGNSMAVPVMRWIGTRLDALVKGTS